jgi:hypothetical protein
MMRFARNPMVINTDDETLGITLVVLSSMFPEGKPYSQVFQAVERLGFSLKGRKEIKRFVRDFYGHYKKQLSR